MGTSSEFLKDRIDDVVNGWRGIAPALGCSVRTAQRWAKAGLIPVHRRAGTNASRVYACKTELDVWKERNIPRWHAAEDALADGSPRRTYIWGWKAIARRLNLSVSTLQLWEREAKLPIHRVRVGRRALPYALENELSAWIEERTVSAETAARVDKRLPLLMHSFLDAWPAHIAVLDTTAIIIAVNSRWRALSRSNGYSEPNLGIGRNYFEVCGQAVRLDAATASRVADGLEEVLAGKCRDWKVKYQCEEPAETRDFLLTVSRFEGLRSPFLVFCHSDVTEVLQARSSP